MADKTEEKPPKRTLGMSTGRKRPGDLWEIAYFAGLVYAFLLGPAVLIAWVMEHAEQADAFMYMVVPVLITFVSIALASKWELISGVVLIVVSLFLMIVATVIEQHGVDLMLFLPLLAVGALFVLSSRSPSYETAPPKPASLLASDAEYLLIYITFENWGFDFVDTFEEYSKGGLINNWPRFWIGSGDDENKRITFDRVGDKWKPRTIPPLPEGGLKQ